MYELRFWSMNDLFFAKESNSYLCSFEFLQFQLFLNQLLIVGTAPSASSGSESDINDNYDLKHPYTLFHEIMALRISLKKEIAIASVKFEKARS
jgi:hypothetical protein